MLLWKFVFHHQQPNSSDRCTAPSGLLVIGTVKTSSVKVSIWPTVKCLFLIVNIIVIELSIIFYNSSLFKNAKKNTFLSWLIEADGLFPCLIRSYCKAIAIKVSYVKKYTSEQKKNAKVPNKFSYPFGPVQYYWL